MDIIIWLFIIGFGLMSFGAGFLGGMFHHFVNNKFYNKKVKRLKKV